MDIQAQKLNESHIRLKFSSRGIASELSDYFSFYVKGHQFMPAYKNKIWDGKIRLCKLLPNGDAQFYVGLMHQLEIFCIDREYTLERDYENCLDLVTVEELTKFIADLNIHSGGKKIDVRDYQFKCIHDFINTKRMVALSPTSSGKSLILFIIIRFLMENRCKKCLLIVPNTSLCHQLSSDFADYSSHHEWDAEKCIHLIFAGKDKDSDKEIILSTWQSLQSRSMNTRSKKIKAEISTASAIDYFKQFDLVLCDEAHLASGEEISNIIEKCTNATYRIGVTGTLNGEKVHSLQLESLFGQVTQVTTTKKLMDKKEVTKLRIKCLILKYPEDTTKLTQNLKYQEEIGFLISNKTRNKFIKNLVLSLKGNTLLLYQFVESHGQILYDLLKESKYAKDKVIYFIHGSIDGEEREFIRKSMETQDNVILVGSVGTVSTGTNIKNLHNIVFASPSKSRVRNLQAIGRILRLSDNKNIATLYDIADDLRYKKHNNYTISHFQERLKIYDSEKFDYKLTKINITDIQ